VRAHLDGIFSSEDGYLATLLEHISNPAGKMLRSALLLMCGRAVGPIDETHLLLGAAIEAVHSATLIHDDVLDEAELRRHAPSVNRLWGNEASVLLGDFLFATAFSLAAKAGHVPSMNMIASAAATVCHGELMQIDHRNDTAITEERYMEIVRKKTAALYSCACKMGAICAGANDNQAGALENYGRNLGVAFQIVDDCLDVTGDEAATGKSLGTDLTKGKFTLPMIWLMRKSKKAIEMLSDTDKLDEEAVREVLCESGAVEYALGVAEKHAENAKSFIPSGVPAEIAESLMLAADYVVSRNR